MAEDEYTPQQVTVTIRTKAEWDGLLARMTKDWRDTPTQQLNAEVEKMLQSAKTKATGAGTGQPHQGRGKSGPRSVAA